MHTLRLSLLLRRLLPNAQWLQRIERNCWDLFWAQEEQKEREVAGDGVPLQPIAGSERAVFIEAIAKCWPFRTILEIGCGFGQNAHILSTLFPNCRYVGVDVDAECVRQGELLMKKSQLTRAKLIQADAKDLRGFPDASVDVLIVSACMLCLDPASAQQVALELVRVAKRAIILLEQHDADVDADGYLVEEIGRPPYWIRNYLALFEQAGVKGSVQLQKVRFPRWTIEQWRERAVVLSISTK